MYDAALADIRREHQRQRDDLGILARARSWYRDHATELFRFLAEVAMSRGLAVGLGGAAGLVVGGPIGGIAGSIVGNRLASALGEPQETLAPAIKGVQAASGKVKNANQATVFAQRLGAAAGDALHRMKISLRREGVPTTNLELDAHFGEWFDRGLRGGGAYEAAKQEPSHDRSAGEKVGDWIEDAGYLVVDSVGAAKDELLDERLPAFKRLIGLESDGPDVWDGRDLEDDGPDASLGDHSIDRND